ncbi:MAG: RNA methyltransferase [Chitinophagaceae bacterium]|nr:RNA methyltransferase [Chitinophagaceae bacterium]
MTPERKARIASVLEHRQPDITVVLDNVHDPRNIAAVLRTCDAVGISEIFVLTDREPRTKQYNFHAGMGAMKWVQVHSFNELEACVTAVKAKYPTLLGAYLDPSAKPLYALELTQPLALVFGNERHGISEAMLQHCSGHFIIPQYGMVESLNISVACAVSLYEALRQKQMAGHYQASRLSLSEQDALLQQWDELRFREAD